MEKHFFVYIMASQRNGTLYCGVTSNLYMRVAKHKTSTFKGFTSKYDVKRLVYYELCLNAESAFHREKRIKKYKRAQKIALIEAMNPEWNDLSE